MASLKQAMDASPTMRGILESKCSGCHSLRGKVQLDDCPHRVKRVDDVFSIHCGDEYDGGIVIKVDREHATVTLEPKEIYYMEGRWQ